MHIEKISLVYFSPTRTTPKVLMHVYKGLALPKTPVQQINLTGTKARAEDHHFGANELLLIGTPCYGGRLPQVRPPLFAGLTGENTPAAIVTTYGNRGYDDILLELKGVLEGNGFVCTAAAAIVTEHAMSKKVGQGRPDRSDYTFAQSYGEKLRKKLDGVEDILDAPPIQVPGKYPYKDLPPNMPLTPVTNDKCTYCMACFQWCPTDAIPYYSPNETDPARCIRCHGCIRRCPIGAREITNEAFATRIAGMEQQLADVHCEPEMFV